MHALLLSSSINTDKPFIYKPYFLSFSNAHSSSCSPYLSLTCIEPTMFQEFISLELRLFHHSCLLFPLRFIHVLLFLVPNPIHSATILPSSLDNITWFCDVLFFNVSQYVIDLFVAWFSLRWLASLKSQINLCLPYLFDPKFWLLLIDFLCVRSHWSLFFHNSQYWVSTNNCPFLPLY